MQIICAGCQKPLQMPDSAAGQPVRCPMCQTVFTAPVLMEIEPVLPIAEPVITETAITKPPPLPRRITRTAVGPIGQFRRLGIVKIGK